MARTDRLFRLLHLMRSLPQPVTAAQLAEASEVSARSIYRDISALRAAGARIEGEAGYGYTLSEDPALPPQMFTRMEVEALMLGLGEVASSGDAQMAEAAQTAGAKIIATLPERVQRQALHHVSRVYRFVPRVPAPACTPLIRQACWEEEALDLGYTDVAGTETERRVLPLVIAYLDNGLQLLAWCQLRQDFRRFNLPRIRWAEPTGESFRPRRVAMIRQYVAIIAAERARWHEEQRPTETE